MYRLRWGSYTWVPALVGAGIVAFAVLVFSARAMGDTWHSTYFVPILGYYVLASICQGHYFKSNPKPNWTGLSRHGVSIAAAIGLFYFHRWLFSSAIGIPEKLVLPGQITFIVLGFFIYGWDDTMFLGRLAKWIRRDALKAIFWYAVVWVLWFLIFAVSGGPVSARGEFNLLNMNVFLGCLQWMIIMQLMMGITWKDHLQKIKFRNDYIRGLSLFAFCISAGVVLGYLSYLITGAMVAGATAELTSADKWHFVLYLATYPLIPLIGFGLYSNHFGRISAGAKRVAARTAVVLLLSVLGYLLFRFVVSPSGVFGTHEWWHDFDLVYNFTIAILLLNHHWFTARLGFLVEAEDCDAVKSRAAAVGDEGLPSPE